MVYRGRAKYVKKSKKFLYIFLYKHFQPIIMMNKERFLGWSPKILNILDYFLDFFLDI